MSKKTRSVDKYEKNNSQISNHISDFNNFISYAVEQYKLNSEEVNRLDKLTQDYLHKLELEENNYTDRAKIATQLAKCRKLRRESKNTVELLTPIMEYYEANKKVFADIQKVLGDTRKVETYMETRSYAFKILDCENIANTK